MPKRWSAIERQTRAAQGPLIAGVDEVGRGPLAGPVVACAVIMPPPPAGRAIAGVDDSKCLTAEARRRLATKIRERAVCLAIGAASVREIDRFNILQATILAMRRALERLTIRPDHILIDGNPLHSLGVEHTAVVDGDARCYSIACASIVAKVTRDRLMAALAERRPGYGWEHNAGYATALHLSALNTLGRTPHHRLSFMPVRQLSFDFGDVVVEDLSSPAVGRQAPDAPAPADPGPDRRRGGRGAPEW